ncbi:hypothetical protein QYF36_010813 [Acer negundo]|nr:hypothetical protein QYF36_010813 [Acer negundo]
MTTNQLTQDLSQLLYIVSGTWGRAWSGFSRKVLWFRLSQEDHSASSDQPSQLRLAVDIMTKELIIVTPDTKVLIAMQLMTDNRIRHIHLIDDKDMMIGMVSIGDVVRVVVSEYREGS